MRKKSYDNILIGGSGFIGSALADVLLEKGESVLSVSRTSGTNLSQGIEELILDINSDSINQLPPAKTVFILIGQNSTEFDSSLELKNLEKLIIVLNQIQPEKVIYLSSVLAYGERKNPAEEKDILNPTDPYSRYKADAELLLQKKLSPEIKFAILRLANVYGSPKNRGFIGFLVKHILTDSSEKIIVNGDGSQERDYIFIDDVINAILMVRNNLQSSDIINIASGKSYSLLDLIAAIEQVTKKKVLYEKGKKEEIEVNSSKIRNDKLRKQYGLTVAHSLIPGLEKTIERYLAQTLKTKLLLLGGEGFIGRNLALKLYQDYECHSIGEKESPFPERKIKFIKLNPYENKIKDKYEVIIHLIDHKVSLENFIEEEKKLMNNISFTHNTHFILFSSAIVYANPTSEYGRRKLALEEFYISYCAEHNISLTIFRPFNVFGPFQLPYRQGSLVANLIYNSVMNQETLINDTKAQRDFVYVEDVARLVKEVLNKRKKGIFDIGSGYLISVQELISNLESVCEKKITFFHKSEPEKLQDQPVADRSWDSKNMIELKQGMAQTVPFYRLYSALIAVQKEKP